jgi:hypothetical protein
MLMCASRSQKCALRVALGADLRRHPVEALRAVLRTCELPVRNRACDTAIAAVKRVDRDEPEMGERGTQEVWRPVVGPGR